MKKGQPPNIKDITILFWIFSTTLFIWVFTEIQPNIEPVLMRYFFFVTLLLLSGFSYQITVELIKYPYLIESRDKWCIVRNGLSKIMIGYLLFALSIAFFAYRVHIIGVDRSDPIGTNGLYIGYFSGMFVSGYFAFKLQTPLKDLLSP